MTPAGAATAGAVGVLGAWLVAVAQAFLTYDRLMVGTEFREPTVLEPALAVVAAALAVLAVGLRVLAAVRQHRERPVARSAPRDGEAVVTARLVAAALVLVAWYAVAVAQWYLVIGQASTDPGRFERDPTLLEHPLVGAAVLALVALGVRLVQRRSSSRAVRLQR